MEYKIKKISEIFQIESEESSHKLKIPNYQRPYKWQNNHVQQLLDDLVFHFKEKPQYPYRLGTVVLHINTDNPPQADIVDGQQRLTTLSLILHSLLSKESKNFVNVDGSESLKAGVDSFLRNEMPHTQSQMNLIENNRLIQDFLGNLTLDRNKFAEYLLNKCELVEIRLNRLDEAFQFFDSQNARGKRLEPYDLLKAYHLRAVDPLDSDLRDYVARWEQAVRESPSLKTIISATLFRLRCWRQGKRGEIFTQNELAVFKGADEQALFPYLQAQKAGLAMYQMAQSNRFMFHPSFYQPAYQISQAMINGKWFFDYIEHYRKLYTELFDVHTGLLAQMPSEKNWAAGEENLMVFLTSYSGYRRTGDVYIRNLFECAVLFYYDKFGKEGLGEAVRQCLHWAYRLRLENKRVMVGTIQKAATDEKGLIRCIEYAVFPHEVARFKTSAPTVAYPDNSIKKLLGVRNSRVVYTTD